MTTSTIQRDKVLIVSHADGYLQVFAEKHVDVLIQRVPQADSLQGERMAEEVNEELIRGPYRGLYRADKCRATGTTRPLVATVLARARAADRLIEILNEASRGLPIPASESEAGTWI